jgi:hypothetical protein
MVDTQTGERQKRPGTGAVSDISEQRRSQSMSQFGHEEC